MLEKYTGRADGPFHGKTVALVSPSSPTVELDLAVQRVLDLGFDVVFENLNKYLSWEGTPKERAEQLNNFFKDPDVDIIWCLRGGMGSAAVIPHIDFSVVRENRKPFIGYSDITILQLAMLKHAGLRSIQFYLPAVTTGWFSSEKEISLLRSLLQEKPVVWPISKNKVYRQGVVEGEVSGGCLDLVCSSIGTPHEVDTYDKVLFLEDVNISAARLYNFLYHMKMSGKLDRIRGLAFSKIPRCTTGTEHLREFFRGIDISPIIFDLDFGHTKRKMPLLLGGYSRIDTEKGQITMSFEPEDIS
ncbi:MAG: LD-carboxypeptidase [Candidatus Woesearchaeota archaeon]